MYSKYLALLLVAIQVAYAAPATLSGRYTSSGLGDCSPSYPGGFSISVVPISGKHLFRRGWDALLDNETNIVFVFLQI